MKTMVFSIAYSVKDQLTGSIIDSNFDKQPLEFITGKGQIIPGLEKRILMMSEGQKEIVVVEPEEAYGAYDSELLQDLPREQFAGIDLIENMVLYGSSEDGETVQVQVKSFSETAVVIDYNHPLAGKTLVFDISVLKVREATEDEIMTGFIGGKSSAGCCGGGGCHGNEPRDSEKKTHNCGCH